MDPHCLGCGRRHAVTLPFDPAQCAVTRYYASTELPNDTVLAETVRPGRTTRYETVPRVEGMRVEPGLL